MILNIVHVNSLIISCLLLGFGNRTKGDSGPICFKLGGSSQQDKTKSESARVSSLIEA